MIYYSTIKSENDSGFANGTVLTVGGDDYTMNNVSSDTSIYKVQVEALTSDEGELTTKLQGTEGVTILTEAEYNALV